MIYILVGLLLFPSALTAGNCCCGAAKNIRIEARLYQNGNAKPLSIDHNDYKINKEGTFKIMDQTLTNASATSSDNRVTIDSVSYDPKQWQALIMYKVRIGQGKVPEVRFTTLQWYASWHTKSNTITWNEDMYVIFEAKTIAPDKIANACE